MAHKKAAGSAKNLRDSNPKYRGVKLFGGQRARAGNIIVRQKGNKYVAGVNVYAGKDYTLHATIDGIVSFRKKKMTRFDGRKYLKTIVDIVSANTDGETAVPSKAQPKAKPAPKAKAPAKKTSATKAATPATGGDDLSKLYGIAKKAAEALNAGGISSFEDLSSAKVGDIRSIVDDAGEKLTADAKDIKKQATLAKNGKTDELKTLQAELKAAK